MGLQIYVFLFLRFGKERYMKFYYFVVIKSLFYEPCIHELDIAR